MRREFSACLRTAVCFVLLVACPWVMPMAWGQAGEIPAGVVVVEYDPAGVMSDWHVGGTAYVSVLDATSIFFRAAGPIFGVSDLLSILVDLDDDDDYLTYDEATGRDEAIKPIDLHEIGYFLPTLYYDNNHYWEWELTYGQYHPSFHGLRGINFDVDTDGIGYEFTIKTYNDLFLYRANYLGHVWYQGDRERFNIGELGTYFYDGLNIQPETAGPPIISQSNTYDSNGIGYLNEHFNAHYLEGKTWRDIVEEATKSITPTQTPTIPPSPTPTQTPTASPTLNLQSLSGNLLINYLSANHITFDVTGVAGQWYAQNIWSTTTTTYSIHHGLGTEYFSHTFFRSDGWRIDLDVASNGVDDATVEVAGYIPEDKPITVVFQVAGAGGGDSVPQPTIAINAIAPLYWTNTGPNSGKLEFIQTPTVTPTATPTPTNTHTPTATPTATRPAYSKPAGNPINATSYIQTDHQYPNLIWITDATGNQQVDLDIFRPTDDLIQIVAQSPSAYRKFQAVAARADYFEDIAAATSEYTFNIPAALQGYPIVQFHWLDGHRQQFEADVIHQSNSVLRFKFPGTPPGNFRVLLAKGDSGSSFGNSASNSFLFNSTNNGTHIAQTWISGADGYLFSTDVVQVSGLQLRLDYPAAWILGTTGGYVSWISADTYRQDEDRYLDWTGDYAVGVFGGPDAVWLGDTVDAGPGLNKTMDANGRVTISLDPTATATPTPSPTFTPTRTPTFTVTPTHTPTWTPTPNKHIQLAGDVTDASKEFQFPHGRLTGIDRVETDNINIPKIYYEATEEELIDTLNEKGLGDGTIIRWSPNGEGAFLGARKGDRIQYQRLFSQAELPPGSVTVGAIRWGDEIRYIRGHYR
jgi:hypothetical protein